jgi:hypothetical protein
MKTLLKLRLLSGLCAVALAVPFSSCTDLEPEVFSDLTPDNFPTSADDLTSAYLAAYAVLYDYPGHGGYFVTQEVSTDELMIPQRGSDWFDGGIWLRTHQQQFDENDPQYNRIWIELYRGALQANTLINTFNTFDGPINEEQRDRQIGELRTLRAYLYYSLTDAFGDVPLVTETSDPNDQEPMPASREEIYAYVINELNESAPALSREIGGSTYGKINYWTNRALLARFLLSAEVMTGTDRSAEAEDVLDEIIDSGLYALNDNYFDNFDPNNNITGYGENMWVIPFDQPSVASGFNLVMSTNHYAAQATFNLQEQPWNGYCTLQEFYDSYDSTDLRKGVYGNQRVRGNFLAGPMYEPDGTTPITDASADDPGGAEVELTPAVNALFPNAYRDAGARVFKFGYERGGPANMKNDYVLVRYAEVLLNKAEAMMRQNKPGGEMFVNMIRERAGLPDMDANMTMDDLLAERGRELFYEGLRRQELIRFGKYTEPWAFKSQAPSTAILFPKPAPQLNANPNLEQNEGY